MTTQLLEADPAVLADDLSAAGQVAAARLDELNHRLEQLGAARRLFLADATAAVQAAVTQAAQCERLWAAVRGGLRAGRHLEPATAAVGTAVAALDRWTGLATAAAKFQTQAGQDGIAIPGAEDLETARKTVARLKAAADKASVFLATPLPPVDWERIEQAVTGRPLTVEQARAALRDSKPEEK